MLSKEEKSLSSSFFKNIKSSSTDSFIETISESDLDSSTSSLISLDSQINCDIDKYNCNYQLHVVFLVHGYQSYYYDMYPIMTEFSKRFPKLELICCKSIDGKDDLGIPALAKLLAKEIISILQELEDIHDVGCISMIGHSMGGLIIRAALKYLKAYKSFFNILVTLGTPHLGYIHSNNKFLSTGIWIVDKFLANQTLKEIFQSDSHESDKTFLYKLSQDKSIKWFKTFIVVGSEQDSYGSLESSTIQSSERIQDLNTSSVIDLMVSNILSNLSHTNFYRLRACFDIII